MHIDIFLSTVRKHWNPCNCQKLANIMDPENCQSMQFHHRKIEPGVTKFLQSLSLDAGSATIFGQCQDSIKMQSVGNGNTLTLSSCHAGLRRREFKFTCIHSSSGKNQDVHWFMPLLFPANTLCKWTAYLALSVLDDLLLRQKAIFIRIIEGKHVLSQHTKISETK